MATRQEPARGWWGRRWSEYQFKEVQRWTPSEAKLRSGHRAQARVRFSRGRVEAEVVSGSYGQTYDATLKVKPLGERDWRRALDAIAKEPEAAHRLLSGSPGPELEEVLARADIRLFPQPHVQVPVKCTCAEGWGCRHINALTMQVADLLDGNPFLWLQVLGKERQEVLAAVRARLADTSRATGGEAEAALTLAAHVSPDLNPDRFWATELDPGVIPVRPGSAAAPDALLRLLGTLPLPTTAQSISVRVERAVSQGGSTYRLWANEERPAQDLLREYAAHISRTAAEVAKGERPPILRGEKLPGKAIAPGTRLAAEIEDAIRQEDGPVTLDRLRTACPTAAALPDLTAADALAEAISVLPEGLIALAGRFVGTRPAMLAGAAFRHVVTFDEWRDGKLKSDADWVTALEAVGCRGPYAVQVGGVACQLLDPDDWMPGPPRPGSLFHLLRPEVGDELCLTVSDPSHPLLVATLTRRSHRTDLGPVAENRQAVDAIRQHMKAKQTRRVSQAEASAVLLGEGFYRSDRAAPPVWLLPRVPLADLYVDTGRGLTTEQWYAWQPRFGQNVWEGWRGQKDALNLFAVALNNQGESKKRVELALQLVSRWCRQWNGPHDQPEKAPSLTAFLNFLWNVAPKELRRYKSEGERAPALLGAWFDFLTRQRPNLHDVYREHLTACSLGEAFARRLRTLPRSTAPDVELALWEAEGHRWMGPRIYFT